MITQSNAETKLKNTIEELSTWDWANLRHAVWGAVLEAAGHTQTGFAYGLPDIDPGFVDSADVERTLVERMKGSTWLNAEFTVQLVKTAIPLFLDEFAAYRLIDNLMEGEGMAESAYLFMFTGNAPFVGCYNGPKK